MKPDEGIEVTLIRWMLWLSPMERLQFMEEQLNHQLKRQTEAQELAVLRRTLEESKKAPVWPQTPQQ